MRIKHANILKVHPHYRFCSKRVFLSLLFKPTKFITCSDAHVATSVSNEERQEEVLHF